MKHWTKSNRLLGNNMILDSLDYNWSVYLLIHCKRFLLNTNLVIKVVHFNFSLDETPLLVWASSLPWTFIFHKEEVEIPRRWALRIILGYRELWNGIWGLLVCRTGNPRSMLSFHLSLHPSQVPFQWWSPREHQCPYCLLGQGILNSAAFFPYYSRLYSLYIMPVNYLDFHPYILPCPFSSFRFSFLQPICPH